MWMFKNMRLVILFDMFLSPSFKMTSSFANIASFFTNIPPQETIDVAINLIFNHNPNLNITKKEL